MGWLPGRKGRTVENSSDEDQTVEFPRHPTDIGHYHVQACLGEGAFGTVYLAEDTHIHCLVAVKLARALPPTAADAVQTILNEARTAAQLKHPGIVAVLDSGRTVGGAPFLVMDYIDGQSLRQRLEAGPLSFSETAELLAEVADAVHFAHSHGIYHRDLKPTNILLDSEGRPHVADFGLALKETEQEYHRDEWAGTLYYMSPEQVRCETDWLDGRTDIWALGVILYEALAARRPFSGSSRCDIREQILERDPRPPRQIDDRIPADLEQICLKCLSKKAIDRYGVAADLAADMRHWLRQQAPEVKPRPIDPQPIEILPNLEEAVSDKGGVLTQTVTREIELRIDRDFASYDDQEQRQLLAAIGELLRIPGGAVRVLSRRRGSVLLKLSLPADAAERLHWAIEAGELRQFGVVESQLSDAVPIGNESDTNQMSEGFARESRGEQIVRGEQHVPGRLIISPEVTIFVEKTDGGKVKLRIAPKSPDEPPAVTVEVGGGKVGLVPESPGKPPGIWDRFGRWWRKSLDRKP